MALAVGEALAERGETPLFIGSARGREAQAVPAAGFRLELLPAAPLAGRGLLERAAGVVALTRGSAAALRLLGREHVPAVVSVGGYAAAPTAAAAWCRGLPLHLVEPNAVPGRLHRLLAPRAERVYSANAATARALRCAPDRVEEVGAPLRKELVTRLLRTSPEKREPGALRLLVMGGSQGARQLNDAVIEALPHLERNALDIVHQTGDADLDRVRAAYAAAGVGARVFAFEPDLGPHYHWADLALCRAGALTLAELALAGLPALLVPYPYAADDHQRANARALEARGAATVLEDSDLDGAALAARLRAIAREPTALAEQARAAADAARPDAAARVADGVLRSLTS